MTAPAKLRLAGMLDLTDAAGGSIAIASQRSQALLAILALEPGHRIARARLATLLWGDRGEEQARASLRQELSSLRRTLAPICDDIITSDRTTIRLDTTLLKIEPGEGEILSGIDIRSEAFEDWLREARAPGETPTVTTVTNRNPILAVLPFNDLTDAQDFFADGVVEEITSALARVRDFDVIARQSTVAVDRDTLDIPAIATALGADYLIEGTVRRAGSRVRISVHLVDGKTSRVLWEERYDDAIDDLFDLQDRIASQIAGAVSPHLRAAEIIRASSEPPANRSAYDLVLTAYPHFWAHHKEANARAVDLLTQATERDPDYPLAIALTAWCVAQQAAYMWSDDPPRDRDRSVELADRAASLPTEHAPTLTAIGSALTIGALDFERADRFLDRALAINPNGAWSWLRRGWNKVFLGEVDPGMEAFATADRLSPLDPFRFNNFFGRASMLHHWTDDTTRAVPLILEGLQLNPNAVWANRLLAAAYVKAGDIKAARAVVDALLKSYPGLTIKSMNASIPTIGMANWATYLDQFRKAGIPEE